MKEVSNEVWEIARDLYDDADFNINRYGEVENFGVMSYEDYNGYYNDCTEAEFNEAKTYLEDLVKDIKYYEGNLVLSDNDTLNHIPYDEIPEEALDYNEENYWEIQNFVCDKALSGLQEEIGTDVYSLGRNGRHICVDDTFDNLTKLEDYKIAHAKWEQWFIDEMIKELSYTGNEVTESLNKGEKKARCLSCGADVIYTNRDVEHDIDGDYIECPNCHATFDVDYDAIEPLLNKKTESKEQWYGYNLIGEYTDKDGVKHTDEISHAFNTEYLKHYAKEHKKELTKYDNVYIKDTAVNEITTTDGIINKDKRIQVTEAEDMSKVKDDVKNAVDKSNSTDLEKDQVKGSIDVLKTDEESAIAGYDEFTKETAKVVDKELSDEIDNQMQEIVDDEKEHIEKLDTIKSALGENKKTEAEDLSYTDSDTKNCKVYYAVNTSGYKSLGLIVNDKDKKFQVVAGQKLRSGSKTAKKSKKQIWDMAKELKANGYEEVRGPSSVAGTVEESKKEEANTFGIAEDMYNRTHKDKWHTLSDDEKASYYNKNYKRIKRQADSLDKKEELFNNSINLNVDAGDIASNNNLDLGGLGALAGLMASEETKKSDDKLEEADETSGTATIDLHTDLVPIINMYQYNIYNMLDEYVGVTREKLDEMMLDFAKPLIEEQIKDVLPSAQITFEEFTHPKYYRLFSNLNDVLDFKVTYNVSEYEALKEKAVQDPEFEKYLQDHYTSYDGFMSFFANNIREFEEQEDWKQFVSVLSYYLPNNGEENYNEMCNYVYENASNYGIAYIDSEVDYVVDEINDKVSNGEIELNKENVTNVTKDLMSYLDEEDQEIIINGVLEAFDLEESKKVQSVEDVAENKKEELFDNTADININANDIASNNNLDLGGLGDLMGMTEAKALEIKNKGVNN